jgi:hypothetical protein
MASLNAKIQCIAAKLRECVLGKPDMDRSDAADIPRELLWINDAPIFIDALNVAQFYDAAVRPPFDEASPIKLKITDTTKKDLEAKFGLKASVGLANWLAAIASSSAEVNAEGKGARSTTSGSESEILLAPISTPHRQLVQLAIFYLLESRQQLLFGDPADVLGWQDSGATLSVPRPLAFIDLPKKTKFIPMAVEFANGKVVTLFDWLLADNGERPPPYDPDKKADYWKWFSTNFNQERALGVLESAASENGSKIEWIDFRVPLNDSVKTMHLHIEVVGKYSTGTFAYRMIRRGFGHGMRVVGALRDGPDVNVLALYEK